MKKKMLTLCLLMAILLLTGCSGDNATSIDGVWRSDVSKDAYVEYEFSDGVGRWCNFVDGDFHNAEGFTYTLDDDAVTILFANGQEKEFKWKVSGKKLTLTEPDEKQKLTAVTRKSVPYLPDGYIAPLVVTKSFDGKQIELSDFETAQLLQLLRSGNIDKQNQSSDGGMILDGYYAIGNDEFELELIDGILYCNNREEAYKLSNIGAIESFLADLLESRKTAENMAAIEGVWRSKTANEYIYTDYEFFDGRGRWIGYGASGIYSVSDFTYTVEGDTLSWITDYTGKKREQTMEIKKDELILTASDGGGTLIPIERKAVPYLPDGFIAPLQIRRIEDGKCVQLKELENARLLELLRSDEVSYRQTEEQPVKAQYSIGDESFQIQWGQGLLYQVDGERATVYKLSKAAEIESFLEGLTWEEAPKAAEKVEPTRVIDVCRIEKTNKALFLSPDKCAEICKLLNQGQATALGEEDHTHDVYFYSITVENREGQTRVIFLSDNGRVYMNGRRYELRTAYELLEKLGEWATEMRIVQYGNDLTEWNGCSGETLEVDLVGVPDAENVVWSSSNDAVCTVTGKNDRAEINIVGLGEAVITVQWQNQSDSFVVTVGEKPDYTSKIDAEDMKAAEALARKDYEAWRNEDWCIRMKVLEAVVNEEESQRLRERYEGSRDGWNREYLVENFVAVKVTYECELDHNKIWYEDGKITKHTFLTRADADSPWEITDYGYN